VNPISIDKLTGLLVQKEFEERLTHEVQRAMRYRRPLTLLLIEVAFDYYGSEHNLRADLSYTIYKQLGALLIRQMRKVDFAGRIGGDMFALLLPETPLAGAFVAGDRIRKTVEDHDFLGDAVSQRVKVALNIGVAAFPDHGTTSDELMATAQKALQMARRDGGNKCVVYPEILHPPAEVFRTMAPPNSADRPPSSGDRPPEKDPGASA